MAHCTVDANNDLLMILLYITVLANITNSTDLSSKFNCYNRQILQVRGVPVITNKVYPLGKLGVSPGTCEASWTLYLFATWRK